MTKAENKLKRFTVETLYTPRLILRKPSVEDAKNYQEITNSDFVLKYNPMNQMSEEDVLELFKHEEMWLLEIKTTKQMIGAIFLHSGSIRFWEGAIECSYFLKESFAQNGYMYEAMEAMIKALFCEENIEVITSRVFSENVASIKLMKKLGFTQDGYIRKCMKHHGKLVDDILFSIEKDSFIK